MEERSHKLGRLVCGAIVLSVVGLNTIMLALDGFPSVREVQAITGGYARFRSRWPR